MRHHNLEAAGIPPMSNGSRMIHPACSICGTPIAESAVLPAIRPTQRVVQISGPVAAGKSTIGRLIEAGYGYVSIDGDAVSKRLNHMARLDPSIRPNEYLFHTEVMRTMMVTLGLGYDVVVGYVFDRPEVEAYRSRLATHGITPLFRVLLPSRDACIARDVERPCWTAGVDFVDKWYQSQCAFREVDPSICIDTSSETAQETVERHFRKYL